MKKQTNYIRGKKQDALIYKCTGTTSINLIKHS